MISLLETAKAIQCERHLESFIKRAWHVLEPNTELKWNWHHSLIAEYLTAVKHGQIKRLIINVPPRSMKSIQVSVCFPCWLWIHDPTRRFMCASYAQALSTKHSVDRRALIESTWYQERWGDRFSMADDQNVKTEFLNDKRGHMLATSMGGHATGKGGNILIIDDPHDTSGAESDAMRQTTIANFDLKFTTRLDDKKNDAIIVVMQRLHEKDLTGHLLERGGCEHVKIPAECSQKTIVVFPMSKKEHIREDGDILHPEREGRPELDMQRIAMGSFGYAGQYQQSPMKEGGNIVQSNWIKHWDFLPERFDFMAQSWDLSFKGEDKNDYVVGTQWGILGSKKYLIDCIRRKMGFTDTIKSMVDLRNKYPKTNAIYVEEKANGAAAIDVLKNSVSGIIPVCPTASKVMRIKGVSPQFEAGNVFFPNVNTHAWVVPLVQELVVFPNSENDDFVDSVSMFLEKFALANFQVFEKRDVETSTFAGNRNSVAW